MAGARFRTGVLVATVMMSGALHADTPRPPSDVAVADSPNDNGTRLEVTWTASPDDPPADDRLQHRVLRYDIRRRTDGEEEFRSVGEATYGSTSFRDDGCDSEEAYWYEVVAIGVEGERSEAAVSSEAVSPRLQWWDRSKNWFALILLFVAGAVVYFILAARRGRELWIRRIAGLEAVDEAVGRATEMGRSCLFVPGIQDINDMQTISGLTVLSRVAGRAAEYGARIEVPTSRSLVMAAARETVQAACLTAGRPDSYNEDDIYYLTDEQFGYVAGVTGTMMRDKPAACFYMGAFFAESLILAETGNAIGAIQVAGTAMPSQLPFFVAACDYTLIGEEFFAASAYLSGEPQQLGSLKGQDAGKLLAGFLILLGCGLATFAELGDAPALQSAVDYITGNILGDKGF